MVCVHIVIVNNVQNILSHSCETLCTGAESFPNAHFGRGTGPLLLGQLSCTGSEQTLLNCSHSGIGRASYYCRHDDDVGIRCSGWFSLLRMYKLKDRLYIVCTLIFCTYISSICTRQLYGGQCSYSIWVYQERNCSSVCQSYLGKYL